MFSIKLGDSLKASSFKTDTKVYIDTNQLLPLSRFLPKPPIQKGPKKKTGAVNVRGGRGGRGRGTVFVLFS